MSLKTRFQLVIAALLLLASIVTWQLFMQISESIIESWGVRTVEIQVRYDTARLMQPVERELALARQMADSMVLKSWARDPEDPELHAAAMLEMESFRRNFSANNFFVALRETGGYYFNNAESEYLGRELRYNLNPYKPEDAWFYQLLSLNKNFHMNVNPDVELGITQLWIDVLMEDEGTPLGIVGTGIPLEELQREVVDIQQAGITTLFVDHSGAIQLHKDSRLIDYATLVKPEGQKNTIALLIDLEEDRQALASMMHDLRSEQASQGRVASRFMQVDGQRHLVGVAYLPGLDWFEVSLIDLNELMPVSQFTAVLVVFIITLLVALLLVNLTLSRLVFKPLVQLEAAMLRLRDGQPDNQDLPRGKGEIGQLIEHFATMAKAIRSNTQELERKVAERTEELNRLARHDPLTELLNRRGMQELLELEHQRCERQHTEAGLIWLDMDFFKQLNDQFGHDLGDRALKRVGDALRATIRPYDHAARWGGDEFLVLVSPSDAANLASTAERLREAIENIELEVGQRMSVSIGTALLSDGKDLQAALLAADQALYRAKAAGRNQVGG
ncbi:MAG: GGDEF domain-containing protein [Gammaproteobacteria bacterium HGW-Gammaproteobacteria-6]|nr:MAG: GGDEF domain-containing protein [Gammaproteobacteria bacterium HGW-Gammaproteobacteria-6]